MLDINNFQSFEVLNVKNHNLCIIIVWLTIYGISSYIFNGQHEYKVDLRHNCSVHDQWSY